MAKALLESQWKKVLKDHPTVDDPGLADALKAYAKSEGKDVDDQLEALEEIVAVAEKIKKQSAKSRNADLSSYLEDVLTEARQQQKRLEDEDEQVAGLLNDEKAYGTYLKKSLTRLVKKPLYFAAGLGTKPEEHRIIFHRSQDGKKLLKTLKDATEHTKFAWGLAGGHAERKGTLTLALEGPKVGGLQQKVEQLLKYFKPLPFDTVLLMVDGEVAEDLPEGSDADSSKPPVSPPVAPSDEETLRIIQQLKDLKSDLETVVAGGGPVGTAVQMLHVQTAQALKNKDFATARANMDRLPPLIARGLRELAEKTPPVGDPATLFNDRLKKVATALQAAAGNPAASELKLRASEAGVLAKRKDFAGANRLLDQVEELLSRGGSGGGFSEDEFRRTMAAAQSTWRECLEAIDGQINQIRSALLALDMPAMTALADRGLPAVTGNHKTSVMVALKEVDGATGGALADAAGRALAAVAAFRRHVESDPRVTVLDENAEEAFGVKVTIGSTLAGGLAALESALKQAAK